IIAHLFSGKAGGEACGEENEGERALNHRGGESCMIGFRLPLRLREGDRLSADFFYFLDEVRPSVRIR
ncbi:hypothetical protein N9118_13035, partial [Akkermansiaceae bacterium]|nr:hypothetical protein [Akkermansiaceae bacterium]